MIDGQPRSKVTKHNLFWIVVSISSCEYYLRWIPLMVSLLFRRMLIHKWTDRRTDGHQNVLFFSLHILLLKRSLTYNITAAEVLLADNYSHLSLGLKSAMMCITCTGDDSKWFLVTNSSGGASSITFNLGTNEWSLKSWMLHLLLFYTRFLD